MTVCAVRCERGTGRRQAFSSRSVLFHRAAGLSEAWGFNARVRPHQTEEKAVDRSSDARRKRLREERKENVFSPFNSTELLDFVLTDIHYQGNKWKYFKNYGNVNCVNQLSFESQEDQTDGGIFFHQNYTIHYVRRRVCHFYIRRFLLARLMNPKNSRPRSFCLQ